MKSKDSICWKKLLLFFLTCKEDFLKKFNAPDSFVINNLTSALKALKYIV